MPDDDDANADCRAVSVVVDPLSAVMARDLCGEKEIARPRANVGSISALVVDRAPAAHQGYLSRHTMAWRTGSQRDLTPKTDFSLGQNDQGCLLSSLQSFARMPDQALALKTAMRSPLLASACTTPIVSHRTCSPETALGLKRCQTGPLRGSLLLRIDLLTAMKFIALI